MNPSLPEAPTLARTALSVALLALLYCWVFPYHEGINNPNENVRIYMTVAVVDDHTFAINRIERDWGYTNDKAARDGRLYSSKAPGTSYLGVPVYWLLTHITHRNSLPPAAILTFPGHHAAHRMPPPRPPLDRMFVIYILRLFCNVLPALVFAWFWHRFLGRRTTSPAIREAVFFSTMAGSSLFAYSEVYASHAHNAYCTAAAIMAIASVRERDREAAARGRTADFLAGRMALAGLFGAAATMFEYPAAIASLSIALWILATAAERRRRWLLVSAMCCMVAAVMMSVRAEFGAWVTTTLALHGHGVHAIKLGLQASRALRSGALAAVAVGVLVYLTTLRWRSAVRLLAAGIGSVPPIGLTLLYHWKCFGDPFTPGYSFLENPQFRAETSQGFFGATDFSWEACLRMWLDPSFGLLLITPILAVSVLGMASYLSWKPQETPLGRIARGWVVRVPIAIIGLGAVVSAGLTLRGAHGELTHPDTGRWLVVAIAALIAFGTTVMPRPRRDDASMGAVMLLTCIALTHLIGMMNNWRGGWQVGPRYMVTLVPILGITALAGLDAVASASPALRRAATVFAGAATVVGFLLAGIPSAFFPHIPTEFTSPFFELFYPLIRSGYFPHNAGHLMGLHGVASMAGFIVAVGVVGVMMLRGDERRPVSVVAHAVGVAALATALMIPAAGAVHPETAGVARYVRSVFAVRPIEPRNLLPPHAPPHESPNAARTRGRALAIAGDGRGALAEYLRAVR